MDSGTDWQPRTTTSRSSTSGTSEQARTLDRLAAVAPEVKGVRVTDLRAGDWVIVKTRNSVYSIAVGGDGTYLVAGGWFAAAGAETRPVRILGCTWGGPAILTGMVAAPGMCVEFDNGVRTTRVREVRTIRGQAGADPH